MFFCNACRASVKNPNESRSDFFIWSSCNRFLTLQRQNQEPHL